MAGHTISAVVDPPRRSVVTVTGTGDDFEALRTERLVLRRFADTDRDAFAALNAEPVVMEHFPSTLDRAASDAMVDRIDAAWDERGWGLWAVEVPGVCPFIGFTGLWPADFVAPGTVEVGWRLAHHAWGHGYAPEAAAAALQVGFERLGLGEIVSFTSVGNTNSRRVMEKVGLTHRPERDFDHPSVDRIAHPHLVRHVLYSVTGDEWDALAGRQ